MTDLRKRIKRRTLTRHRGRRIVVTLHPGDVIGFREEHRRREFLVSIAGAYEYAVRLEIERRRALARRKTTPRTNS